MTEWSQLERFYNTKRPNHTTPKRPPGDKWKTIVLWHVLNVLRCKYGGYFMKAISYTPNTGNSWGKDFIF